MNKTVYEILETYLMVLVHPFRIHQQFRYNVSLPGHNGYLYEPLSLPESLGVSWVFAIIRGLAKLLILNFFLQSFLSMQNENFPFLQDLMASSGISTYYFLLFSAALDIIFFPITTLVVTQFWSWIIRCFTKLLNPQLPAEQIAEQITTHALSAHTFYLVPLIGDFIQGVLYYFLLYAGLRSNLSVSRPLAMVILLTPTLLAMMLLSLAIFVIFYLVS